MSEEIKKLQNEVKDLKDKLFKFRIDKTFDRLTDTSKISKTKKEVARLLTKISSLKVEKD